MRKQTPLDQPRTTHLFTPVLDALHRRRMAREPKPLPRLPRLEHPAPLDQSWQPNPAIRAALALGPVATVTSAIVAAVPPGSRVVDGAAAAATGAVIGAAYQELYATHQMPKIASEWRQIFSAAGKWLTPWKRRGVS